jgi:rhodanese-related sulfurtransferase
MRPILSSLVIVIVLSSCAIFHSGLKLSEIPRIDREQLLKTMDDPNLTILDVRTSQDWYEATLKIKGAIRETPAEWTHWISKYPKDRRYVLYCE